MDVFSTVLATSRAFLRQAVINAAHELGVCEALETPLEADEVASRLGSSRHRLGALLDVMALEGLVDRVEGGPAPRYQALADPLPAAVPLPASGWGRLAEVIRRDRPLEEAETAPLLARYHRHLAEVGRAAAEEVARRFLRPAGRSLLDVGGGIGTYAQAHLDAHPRARATLVDRPAVIELAREHLRPYTDRVELVAGDFDTMDWVDRPDRRYDVALLANLLHLHGRTRCQALIEHAVARLVPGGWLVVKDVRLDHPGPGPALALWFTLNMSLYTDRGRVYDVDTIAGWLGAAGLQTVAVERLECSRDAVVVAGRRPEAE
jgi:SAM-dependent methyltransferase